MKSIREMLKGLTLEDLREWAGSKIYNRGKDYVSNVSQLSRTEDGTLVAWVTGSDEYATSVRHEGEGDFDSDCTCPYDDWGPCKHAVAVLLAAAEQLKQNRDIPLLDPADDLYLEAFDEDDDWSAEDVDDDREEESSTEPPKGRSPQLEKQLADKSRDELLALLIELALDFPEVSRRLRDRGRLETGQVDQLVRSLRKEIRNLTAEDAWYNPWKHEGNLPDYTHVEEQLEALFDEGHADAVFELGEELWARGIKQAEQSHDEGETALSISACLAIVLRALPQTSLPPSEQLLWLVEHEIDDQYDLLGGVDAVLNDPRYTQDHWREISTVFEAWLKKMESPKSGHFSATYHRERVLTWLRNAYSRSGQPQKVIPLLEKEADRCRSYDLLVNALLEAGEQDRARHWCIRGYQKTIVDAPGIASGLQKRLRELAEMQGRFDLAAAYRAEVFFERPSESAYIELREVAEKIKVWSGVRTGILNFLQTGRQPVVGGKEGSAWPLPEPEVKKPDVDGKVRLVSFPNRKMLIEIAILEQRFDDAVTIYREHAKTRRWGWDIDKQLAIAVSDSHPEVALQIWQSIAEGLIALVKPKAYIEAAGYLRQMHKVYEQTDRLSDWKTLIMTLRTQHKAKRRLMEVLDGLEGDRKLIDF
jgi:uncharacterized Zn finger protein